MATTRIMPLHVGKGRTESRAISDIIDYVANRKAAKSVEVFICKFRFGRIDNVHCTLYNPDYT